MTDRFRMWVVSGLLAFVVGVGACSERGERLNAPPQGNSARPSELQGHFVYMTDNAALQDSSVADIHFEPHVADLNGLGLRKLTRLGELLSVTGGEIHYETGIEDAELIAARVAAVESFLSESGFNMESIEVVAGRARSAPGSALETLEAREKAKAADHSAAATTQ